MSEFWARKMNAAQASEQQEREQEAAAELRYRNPNLGANSQAWIDRQSAKDVANREAAAASYIGGFSVERAREEAHLRAVQAYSATAHRVNRGLYAFREPNPADLEQYDLQRPRSSYSDYF
ncbi:hypothetical protein ACWCYZ_39030 [Streptomyces virginiae]